MRFSFEIVKGESFLINLSSEVLIGSRGKFDCRLRAKGELKGFGSMRAWPEKEGGTYWLGEGLIQFTLVLIIRRFEFGQGSEEQGGAGEESCSGKGCVRLGSRPGVFRGGWPHGKQGFGGGERWNRRRRAGLGVC